MVYTCISDSYEQSPDRMYYTRESEFSLGKRESQGCSRNSLHLIESKDLLLCSYVIVLGHYPEPAQSSPHLRKVFIYIHSHVCLHVTFALIIFLVRDLCAFQGHALFYSLNVFYVARSFIHEFLRRV